MEIRLKEGNKGRSLARWQPKQEIEKHPVPNDHCFLNKPHWPNFTYGAIEGERQTNIIFKEIKSSSFKTGCQTFIICSFEFCSFSWKRDRWTEKIIVVNQTTNGKAQISSSFHGSGVLLRGWQCSTRKGHQIFICLTTLFILSLLITNILILLLHCHWSQKHLMKEL